MEFFHSEGRDKPYTVVPGTHEQVIAELRSTRRFVMAPGTAIPVGATIPSPL